MNRPLPTYGNKRFILAAHPDGAWASASSRFAVKSNRPTSKHQRINRQEDRMNRIREARQHAKACRPGAFTRRTQPNPPPIANQPAPPSCPSCNPV